MMTPTSFMKLFVTTQLLFCSGALGAITLYAVDPPAQTGGIGFTISQQYSASYSAGGVDSEGRTTVVEEYVISVVEHQFPTETFTYSTSPNLPTTAVYTYAVDASGYVGSPVTMTYSYPQDYEAPVIVWQQNCTFEGTTQGVCVNEIVNERGSMTETALTTYTGSLRPYATLESSNSNSGEGVGLNFRTGMMPMGFLSGLVLSSVLFALRVVF